MGCVLNWDGDWQEEISRMISRFLSHAQGHMVVPFTGQEKPGGFKGRIRSLSLDSLNLR